MMKLTKKQKKQLIQILTSGVLLAVASFLPLDGIWQALVFVLPYAVIGYDVLIDSVRGIFRGQLLDEKFLMAIATVGAYALKDYREAVAVMLFYKVGELFESIAVGKSRRSVRSLMQLRPDHATVMRGGEELILSPEEIAVGEEIIVRPGERIPLDGVILEGQTSIDTSALSGESMPRDAKCGDEVLSGTVNLSATLRVRVTKPASQSTVTRIMELVENASSKKTRSEAFITRFAHYYTPIVVGAAVVLAVLPPLLLHEPFAKWLERALLLLVVSCPCALVVSVPLSFFSGIGCASRKGILIKGSGYMEQLAKLGVCVFDKTGTLTKGQFSLTKVHAQDGDNDALLSMAAALEENSNHPIARSIVSACPPERRSAVSEFTEQPGLGVSGILDDAHICAGNRALMEHLGIVLSEGESAGTVIHVARENEYLGYLVIEDREKDEAKQALAALHAQGVQKLVMLTGDREGAAKAVASRLGIDEYHASLLPGDKVGYVEGYLGKTGSVAFVGDGINDAPVLSRADVGIAMGAMGSDAALEAADVVLMQDKLTALPLAVRISRKTKRIVMENIVAALAVKAVVLVLGALGVASMWIAIFADVGVLILAVLNAMRALTIKD